MVHVRCIITASLIVLFPALAPAKSNVDDSRSPVSRDATRSPRAVTASTCGGDVNLDGTTRDSADALFFVQYLLHGPSVLSDSCTGCYAYESDLKRDGTPWEVADFVNLARWITGDIRPPEPSDISYPCWPPDASISGSVTVTTRTEFLEEIVSCNSATGIGAILLTFAPGDGPILDVITVGRAKRMDVVYDLSEDNNRILVYSLGKEFIRPGSGDILRILTLDGSPEFISVEAAGYMSERLEWTGAPVAVNDVPIKPDEITLLPNYPNPFNPSTTFAMDFSTATRYTLAIYNVTGQTLRHFDGTAPSGRLEIKWDGRDDAGHSVGSGVYFYRLTAGDFDAVHKMVLLK